MMAWCWGFVAAAAAVSLILASNGPTPPENSVGKRLLLVLAAGTSIVLFLNRRKTGIDYQQVARDIEEKHPELHATLPHCLE